jgi:hypothetical protein
MIERIEGLGDDVVGFVAKGEDAGADYEEVLVPAIEAGLEKHDKLSLLYVLGDEFSGYELAAMWDDTKVGMEHLFSWERIGVVTDHDAYKRIVQGFGFLIPAKVRVFPVSERVEAEAWVMSSVPPFHTNQGEYPDEHRNVYHDHAECSYAKAIKREHRIEGTDGRPRCTQCERLAQRHPG